MSGSTVTCYKAACPSGYYLTAPSSTYFTSTSTAGNASGLTCYKATGCATGYSTTGTGTGATYHGTTCKKNECPSGYFYADSQPVIDHMLFLESLNNPGCYKASCAPGYSTIVNGSVVAEYQGVKCYKVKEEYWPTVLFISIYSDGCDMNGQPDERMCYFRGNYILKDDKGLSFADRMYKITKVKAFGGNNYDEVVYWGFEYGPYVDHMAYVNTNIGERRASDGYWFRNSGMRLNGKKVTGTYQACIYASRGSTIIDSVCLGQYGNQSGTLDVVMENTDTNQTKTATLRVETTLGDGTSSGGIIDDGGLRPMD